MASTVTLEGVKKAVFFPFTGEKWGIKLLIGSALMLAASYVPLLGIAGVIAVQGYYARIMKRVILEDEDPGLPEWKDWGGLFLDGVKLLGASLIYCLPAILLIVGGYVLFFVLDIATVISSTTMNPYSQTLPPEFLVNMLGMFGGIGIVMIGFLLMLVASVILPPALGNMIAKGSFSAAFHFREWWQAFKINLGGYLLVLALLMGTYTLLMVVFYIFYFTIILCILLPIAMSVMIFLLGAVYYSLTAVAYRDATRKLNTGVPAPLISSDGNPLANS